MNPVNIDGGPKDAKTSMHSGAFGGGRNWSQPSGTETSGSTPQGGVAHSTVNNSGLKAHSPLQTGAGSVTEYQQKSPHISAGKGIPH